jgi:hypothetical protein
LCVLRDVQDDPAGGALAGVEYRMGDGLAGRSGVRTVCVLSVKELSTPLRDQYDSGTYVEGFVSTAVSRVWELNLSMSVTHCSLLVPLTSEGIASHASISPASSSITPAFILHHRLQQHSLN